MANPSRWSGVTVDCLAPERLSHFWARLLQAEVTDSLPGWVRFGEPGQATPVINFQPVPEPKQGKTRIHLDVTVDDIDEGVATVVGLGGRGPGERHDYDEGVMVVMSDPEDNEFCLVVLTMDVRDGVAG
jgi:predicted enzyme related to lactoylglutathione lyase